MGKNKKIKWILGTLSILIIISFVLTYNSDRSFWIVLFGLMFWTSIPPIVVWQLAKHKKGFVFMRPNQVSILEYGSKPQKLIGFPPKGHRFNEDLEIEESKEKPYSGIFDTGIFFIGFVFTNIKLFGLVHERFNAENKNWIEREEKPRIESFLQTNPVHHFRIDEIELSDGSIVDVLAQLELVLIKPTVSLYDRAGSEIEKGIFIADFYGTIGDRVKNVLNDAIKTMVYQNTGDAIDKNNWILVDKKTGSNFSLEITRLLNENGLDKISGYGAVSFSITQSTVDKEFQEAAKLKKLAVMGAEAEKAKAEAANARLRDLISTLRQKKEDGDYEVDPTQAAKMATDLETTRELTKLGGLSVYAPGANMAISTPPKNEGKGKKDGGKK